MKRFIIIAIVLVCLVQSQEVQECSKNCSNKKESVCGIKIVKGKQEKTTYQNECKACQKSDFTVEGKCSDYPNDAIFCSPDDSKGIGCPTVFEPSCGWFNDKIKCFFKSCTVNIGSRCGACRLKNVLYTTKGNCPRQ